MRKSFLKYNKKFVAFSLILMCFVMAFSVVSRTFAIDLAANQNRKSELEAESTRLNEVLDEAKKGKLTAVDKKIVYEQKKSLVSQQVRETNKEIEQQNKDIANQEKVIAEREKQLKEDQEKLKVRITAIYTAGESTTLDCILNAKDFSDFMDKAYILKSVSDRDTLMIENAKVLLTKLNEEKDVLEENREQLTSQKAELSKQESEYLKLIAETNDWMKQLDANEQKVIRDIDNNNLEIQQINAKIEQYYEEQRLLEDQRKREEEQRLQEEARIREQEEAARQRQLEEDRQAQTVPDPVKIEEDSPQLGIQQIYGEQSLQPDPQPAPGPDHDYEPDPEPTPDPEINHGINGLVWPVPGFTWLSSEYNESREGYFHGGIDIAGAEIYGTPIVAAASGTVSTSWYCDSGWGGGYGTYCMIDHAAGRSTLYAHMSAITVSPGQYVEQGQIIGYVGSTGDSTGPHLHFETRQNGVRYNPMSEF